MDREVERLGDLDEAGDADAGVIGRFAPLDLVEHSPTSWRKLVRAKNPLVEQIRLDGIALDGDAASLLERHR